MKYKVGDEVVLRDDIKVGNSYGDVYVSEELQSAIGGSVEILEKGSGFPRGYYVANGSSIDSISETMIDHEKTAELQTDRVVKHYTNELEKIVAEKNKVDIPVVDTVNRPPHYTQGDIEVIDIIEVLTNGYTGYQGYLVGNVVKYIARANFKGNKLEDLKKAEFYYNRLLEVVEGEK